MSYSIFKKDNPAFFILCPLISLLLCVPALLIEPNFIGNNNGLSLFSINIPGIWNITAFAVFGNILAFAQHFVLVRNEVFRPMSFAPWVFLFAILLIEPSVLASHTIILGLTCCLITFAQIVDLYGQKAVNSFLFNAGFFTGLASIFFFPFLFLMVVIWFCAFNCRALKFRGIVLSIYGLICPWVIYLCLVYFFSWDVNSLNFTPHFSIETPSLENPYVFYILIELLLIVVGSWFINHHLHNKTLKEKSILQNTLIFVLALTLLGLFVFSNANHRTYTHLLLAIPVAICSTFIVYINKTKWISDTVLILLIIAFAYNYYLLLKP